MGNDFTKNTNRESTSLMHRLRSNETSVKKESFKNPLNFLSQPFICMPAVTILIYFLTKNPFTGSLRLQLTLLSFIALLIYGYILKKKGVRLVEDIKFRYLLTVVVLFLIASTGWFFSPFFFVLYLWAIFLAFIFSPKASLSFIITLVILFSFNIGEVDLAYDFMIVLSLLTTIPLSLYLRKEYLKLKESEKVILVLQKEKENNINSAIEEILANKINNIAVNLRQPINDIKQLSFRMADIKEKQKLEINRERILASSEEALRVLKEFEEQSTGKKLVVNPGSPQVAPETS
ncbi:hypothetical protein HYU93_02750 [Candidatus Daviesbacteria bacterium]|nr:hypothetical protein [Candidatus Daviesbacteria bacterium]